MIANVAVENALFAFDMLYSYSVPKELEGSVGAGRRVVVPFGRGNKRRIGLVMETSDEASAGSLKIIDGVTDGSPAKSLKPISAVIDETPVIGSELLALCVWLRENTFCTYYDAFRTVLPPGLGYQLKRKYSPVKDFSGELTKGETSLLGQLKTADKGTFSALTAANPKTVASLTAKGALREECTPTRRVGDESVRMVRLVEGWEPEKKLTGKQRAVLEFLEETGAATVHEVCYNCAVTAAVVKTLEKHGALEEYEKVVFRTETDIEASEDPESIVLSPKQQDIFNGLMGLMNAPDPKCALLRGVTGSGKTSIFIRMINEALKAGKSAIMLVPEISLTPQMVGRFKRLFGNGVAIMHSSLSLGERADEYRRIREGKARIVIGTRSAVFAPVSDLGIVVIDEEGEGSYKSESSPRYHARDVAKQRCFAHNAMLLLASATPSLESYYFAKNGRYSLFEIDERYNNAALPDVYIINMAEERQNGNNSSFSEPLMNELAGNLDRGEQSILLLNRRGYRTSVRCLACGKPLDCPVCGIPMTYHKVNDSVICHCCGYSRRMDRVCPKCGGRFFNMKGEGTQLIEDELAVMFPKARILRMDADTTSGKDAFERRFRAFADGEYDIMVGTQMIAKGLDFPNVTLVGVLKTDNLLYAADFKAYERTFSLITQVVGRAGRANKRGRALIQTFSPEHFVVNLAACQNYPAFYEEEIALRREQFYPPMCDITVFGFAALAEDRCRNAAKRFADILLDKARPHGDQVPLRILGPAPNAVEKAGGRYRFSLIVKCVNNRLFRSAVHSALIQAHSEKMFENVAFFADINGNIG